MKKHSLSNTHSSTSQTIKEQSAVLRAAPHSAQNHNRTVQVDCSDEPPLIAADGASTTKLHARVRGTSAVQRGITAQVSTTALQCSARERTLLLLNRFRVIRTIDVAVLCYPERSFKAALTAAQRAVRGMVKEQLIRRYKSDRFQTIYALTARGARWLQERGHENAMSSVRRVSDMTNPEHRLWLQLLVVAAEARGLQAETEQELLRRLNLNARVRRGERTIQGLLNVRVLLGGRCIERTLRPDALLREPQGATWVEVDRSKRGAEREASLRALALSVGAPLQDGQTLNRVVIFCKNERIQGRALALLRELERASQNNVVLDGRRSLKEVCPGTFEVTAELENTLPDGRIFYKKVRVGFVVIQLLPTWLPNARFNVNETFRCDGWMDDDYLPYRRAGTGHVWPALTSPLLLP